MMLELWEVFVGILYLIIFVAIIISVIFFKHLPKPYKILAFLFFSNAVFEIASLLFRNFSEEGTNLFISPISNLAVLVILSLFYLKYVLRSGKYRTVLIGLSSLSVVLVSRDVIYALGGDFQNLHFVSLFYCSLIIAVFAIAYFLQIAIYPDVKIVKNYVILSIVFFLQALFGMLFAVAINFMINESLEIVSYFWIARLIILLATNVILMLMIWKIGRTRRHLQLD
ncbi:MAG: hypothetical protein ACLFM1_00495 [Bacteroidales bacterium]